MTELGDIFTELGISQYLDDFVSNGFDSWETILDIKESDFEVLGVKVGHRRKLQRRIANARGISSDKALGSPPRAVAAEDRASEEHGPGATRPEAREVGSGSGPQGAKRKYKRHPKPDPNAPERPPSAYVIFSNKMREDIKGQNLSFTEIAKLVGENWQSLRPLQKESYEQQANGQKEAYAALMLEYRKTPQFREYDQYLKEFKARQSNQQQATPTDAKRPKLEPHGSHDSGETISSGASQHGVETPSGRLHGDSPPLGQCGDTHQSPLLPSLSGASRLQGSPTVPTSTSLPGYRDSILTPNQHTLSWREAQRDEHVAPQLSQQYPRMEQRPSYPVGSLNLTGSQQFAHLTGNVGHQHPTPPSLTPESTAGSTSTTSTSYYSPRTPMDPNTGPSHPYFIQKPSSTYENQLPPLHTRTPSLSPQGTNLGLLHSPNGIPPMQGYQHTLPPVRDLYTPSNPQQNTAPGRPRNLPTINDASLDILAKAAELADRKPGGPLP